MTNSLFLALTLLMTGNGVILTWKKHPDAAYYNLYVINTNLRLTNVVRVATNSYTMTNLVKGNTYSVQIAVVNHLGLDSELSLPTTFMFGILSPPTVHTHFLINTPSSWTFTTSWHAAPGASGYYLKIAQNGRPLTNIFTTNLSARVVVPKADRTNLHLQSTNAFGASRSVPVATYVRPTRPDQVSLILP